MVAKVVDAIKIRELRFTHLLKRSRFLRNRSLRFFKASTTVVNGVIIIRLQIRKNLTVSKMSKFLVDLQNVAAFYEFVTYEFF